MKKCTNCKEEKPFDLFRSAKGSKVNKDGKKPQCLECELTQQKEMRRSLLGKLKAVYHNQIYSSKQRGHEKPLYSLSEFVNEYINDNNYIDLHSKWVNSGYQIKLSPSFDRKDDYKGYSFDNLNKWMTFEDNNKKYHSDSYNGINNKQNKAVIMTDIETGDTLEFHSANATARYIGYQGIAVSRCCTGLRNKHKGYTFRYKETQV